MTARSLALPAAQPASAPRERTYLSVRVRLAFGALLLLQAAATWLAASRIAGVAGTVAIALGLASLVLTAATEVWLIRRLVKPLGPATGAAMRLSAGDLGSAIDAEGSGELRKLMLALQLVRERLAAVVGDVRTGTANVALNAAQISRENDALSVRTDTQADSLQETASSMEQLTAAVRHTAGTAQRARILVQSASDRAQQGGEVMRQVVETMDSIRASSQDIREIIGVIDGIAFQTNILALNAAVEAARAGEQGRGFAVVAAEVRSLAQRSAGAARDVKELISASVQEVDTGGTRVDEAGRAMAEIVAAVKEVAELIAQIDTASREQSSGLETINAAVNRIDTTTQDNAGLVKGAARTAAALQERAASLMNAVAGFQLGSDEHGSKEEAVALVHDACQFLRSHGLQALNADVNKLEQGRFIHRDLYLLVLGVHDAVFTGHGNNPGRLGKGPDVRDVDGKAFPVEMARVARDRGEGWVDYKWEHPVSKQVFLKTAYVRREGDVVIGCAAYKA
ncbi:methyl-accepting chemotaxis protein [Ramlibacter sp. XY19]|uniref:methyl-accepting chemotaxis protein n=1 Tax=Ramlibacter paludis TaxID=2908000 RepID=UPI0023DB32E4|nr:methyl-accepting chemotaxis protein [Ramlibacter paludis]MCG2594059.1 methyl-accepting chemotaxis protein [Ramlibacter paludis]